MKKKHAAFALLSLAVPRMLHSLETQKRLSLIDAEHQFVVTGLVPFGSACRFELNNFTLAYGSWVMFGATLYQVSFTASAYSYSSFLPLRMEIPIFTHSAPSFGVPPEALGGENPFRAGVFLTFGLTWLTVEPEGRHLEVRRQYLSPLWTISAGTYLWYGQSAAYSPNLSAFSFTIENFEAVFGTFITVGSTLYDITCGCMGFLSGSFLPLPTYQPNFFLGGRVGLTLSLAES